MSLLAARYYVTMDILRRVMEDYFGYSIEFVMNVTDVDDKIIRRARLNHLLQNYLRQTPDSTTVHTAEHALHTDALRQFVRDADVFLFADGFGCSAR